MLSNYEKASKLIQNYVSLFTSGINLCCKNVINQKIRNMEEILEIIFPPCYVMFLQTFGVLNFGEEEVFGVLNYTKPFLSNMLSFTLDLRKNCMPSNLIVIHELGDGTRDCLQINEKDPDNSPVVEYHDPESPVRVIAPDFGTFLLKLVEQEIQFYEERKLQEQS